MAGMSLIWSPFGVGWACPIRSRFQRAIYSTDVELEDRDPPSQLQINSCPTMPVPSEKSTPNQLFPNQKDCWGDPPPGGRPRGGFALLLPEVSCGGLLGGGCFLPRDRPTPGDRTTESVTTRPARACRCRHSGLAFSGWRHSAAEAHSEVRILFLYFFRSSFQGSHPRPCPPRTAGCARSLPLA